MTDSYAVQVNPTIGGVLWNVRGDTAEEFKNTIDYLSEHASDLQDALAVLQQAGLANQAVAASAPVVNPGTPPPAVGSGGNPSCSQHGPMEDKAGAVTKNGQPYRHRYYCSKFGCKETAD